MIGTYILIVLVVPNVFWSWNIFWLCLVIDVIASVISVGSR